MEEIKMTPEELHNVHLVIEQGRAWSPSTERLLREWKKQITHRRRGHHKYAGQYKNRHYATGILSIVLGAVVTTAIFSTFRTCSSCNGGCTADQWIRFTNGFCAVFSVVISGIHTFLGYDSKSENHKSSADSYDELLRQIDTLLRSATVFRGDPVGTLNLIRSRYDDITRNAPSLPSKYNQELGYQYRPMVAPRPEDVADVEMGIQDESKLRTLLKDAPSSGRRSKQTQTIIEFDLDAQIPSTTRAAMEAMEFELERLHANSARTKNPLTRTMYQDGIFSDSMSGDRTSAAVAASDDTIDVEKTPPLPRVVVEENPNRF